MTESRKESVLSVSKPSSKIDLDDVLVNELGEFGRFQFRSILLLSLPIIVSAFMSEFIFSAAEIPHRCYIEECGETNQGLTYSHRWASNAVPAVTHSETDEIIWLSSCERFAPTGRNGSLASCPASIFYQDRTVQCDGYVYARDNSVVYDFNLGCQEWMRALAGTLNSVGTLLVLPITGYISDRFGRRIALIINVFNLGFFGFIRAFSINYPMYLVLQILQTTLGAGTYSSAYIMATEFVGPKYRVLTSATCASIFAIGQIILGAVAWVIQPWRYMIMAIHAPCFLIIFYYWILSESVRWLLSKGKNEKAKIVLEKVARENKTEISEKSLLGLMCFSESAMEGKTDNLSMISTIIKSPVLLRRVCTTPMWWITTIFVYYGLSINSTSLSDTMYLNFILACAIEIPGNYTAVLVLDRIGRRSTLFYGFILSSVCNIAFAFLPAELTVLRLLVFLAGKFGISVVLTSLYLYTSELYPTQYRHSLLAFSSMIGRVGSITAPLTPVLMQYWAGIPSVMFGTMGFISAALVLTQPETLGTKMPDTLAEAEALGRPELVAQTT